MLELEILKELQKGQQVTDVANLMLCDVDRFYGIEYEEFPAQIAQVALWLIDHQMNMLVSMEFGEYFVRLPLRKSAKIVHGNALQTDWDTMIEYLPWESKTDREQYDYILGNPPFIGKSLQNAAQKSDMELIFNGVNGAGVLDYVTAWYIKAAQYLQKHNTENKENDIKTRVAFVSTNSISQGEQVGVLWNEMFNRYKIKIHFAHRTFKWSNEAKGNAGVHVVIIGFSNYDFAEKSIFEYEDIKGEPHELKVKNINPYLVEGKDIFISKRRDNICNMPEMNYGSMPNDGGFLLMNEIEKNDIINKQPQAEKYIRKFVMGDELINSIPRYCIWIENFSPNELKSLSLIIERIEKVKINRLSSTRAATKELGAMPYRFGEVRQPKENYIALPRVSSENRKYIPITILDKSIIAGDKVYTIEKGDLYHFGILFSEMHMSWMRLTAGRLESRFS
jgi:hypothetical protein